MFLSSRRHRGRAVTGRISYDRLRLGARWSARLKRRSLRHGKNNRGAIKMLDRAGGKHRRQLRRLRNERARREIDGGADRAVIVVVIAGLLRGNRLRYLRSRAGDIDRRRGTMDAVNMDVPER